MNRHDIKPTIIIRIIPTTEAIACPKVYVFNPPVKLNPVIFDTIQKPESLTVAPNSAPSRHARAINTGWIATVVATLCIIAKVVSEATVPDPAICLNSSPRIQPISRISTILLEILDTIFLIASLTPDAVITEEKDPPAPVIKIFMLINAVCLCV